MWPRLHFGSFLSPWSDAAAAAAAAADVGRVRMEEFQDHFIPSVVAMPSQTKCFDPYAMARELKLDPISSFFWIGWQLEVVVAFFPYLCFFLALAFLVLSFCGLFFSIKNGSHFSKMTCIKVCFSNLHFLHFKILAIWGMLVFELAFFHK